jgi:hypothetical protein
MTVGGLSKRLRRLNLSNKTPNQIEEVLIEHSKQPNKIIRHAYYPSKKSLNILWGSIEVVGKQENLPDLERRDEATPKNVMDFDKNTKWFFLSYNHRDVENISKIKEKIESNDFAVWTYETEINEGELIINSVREAIKFCDYFIGYVTRKSIGSLWVQKEIRVATKPFICIDGSDDDLLKIFLDWENKWPPDLEQVETLTRKDNKGEKWVQRSKDFMRQLNESLNYSNQIVAFPYPEAYKTKGKELDILSFDEFMNKF